MPKSTKQATQKKTPPVPTTAILILPTEDVDRIMSVLMTAQARSRITGELGGLGLAPEISAAIKRLCAAAEIWKLGLPLYVKRLAAEEKKAGRKGKRR